MKTKLVLACYALAIMATLARGEETDPQEIFKKTQAAYASLSTLSIQWIVVQVAKAQSAPPGQTYRYTYAYSFQLKRPNQYLLTFKSTMSIRDNHSEMSSGAIWNDGKQPWVYVNQFGKSYGRIKYDWQAIQPAGFGGSSGRATMLLIYSRFFTPTEPETAFAGFELMPSEQVNGEDCYVLHRTSQEEKGADISDMDSNTVWISKTNFLVRKYSLVKGPPLLESLEAHARKAVAEEIRRGKSMSEDEQAARRAEIVKRFQDDEKDKIRGPVIANLPKTIASPKFTDEHFSFKLPADAKYKVFEFGGLPQDGQTPQ